MRSLLSFTTLIIFSSLSGLRAQQQPFFVYDSVDINKHHIPVSVHGNMLAGYDTLWSKTDTSDRWVKRSNFTSLFHRVWLSGYDPGNSLHISIQTHYNSGPSFWPGPLDASGAIDYTTSEKWAKIWKVNSTDVRTFLAITNHTRANTPQMILTWPGKGNILAAGNNGAFLTINTDMAPFVDLNGNGIYEPLLGEYPDFKGDQALWWIFSDNGPSRSKGSGLPLGVEVHAMAYAYNRGSLIDNVVYMDYELINKSANTYHDVRLADWSDEDLGWYLDDFIGFDSARRLGILYNGTNDDGGGGGHPINAQWGTNPAMSGTTMISLPGDEKDNYVPAGSFIYFNNDLSFIGNPYTDVEGNNYMRARMKNGQHYTNDFNGPGIPSNGLGSGPACNYLFTGDPSDPTQWSECTCNNNPGDRRYTFASNDFTLSPGSPQHIVMAYLLTDTPDGGCPRASFAKIRELSDTAWSVFYNPLPPLYRHMPGGSSTERHAYPNPAHDKVSIDGIEGATITVYNSMGQTVHVPIIKNGEKYEVDISNLPRGLYSALYRTGNETANTKFMKE